MVCEMAVPRRCFPLRCCNKELLWTCCGSDLSYDKVIGIVLYAWLPSEALILKHLDLLRRRSRQCPIFAAVERTRGNKRYDQAGLGWKA